MEREHISHAFAPVFDSRSKVLILGTMPSPKSRENGFYYSHPQNRFWRVMAQLLQEEIPKTTEEKKRMMLGHGIALWDVLAQCDIKGADDNSIQNPVANDIKGLIGKTRIKAVFTTGATAARLYEKLVLRETGLAAKRLLSTSPANCRFSVDMLAEDYRVILEYLKDDDDIA